MLNPDVFSCPGSDTDGEIGAYGLLASSAIHYHNGLMRAEITLQTKAHVIFAVYNEHVSLQLAVLKP